MKTVKLLLLLLCLSGSAYAQIYQVRLATSPTEANGNYEEYGISGGKTSYKHVINNYYLYWYESANAWYLDDIYESDTYLFRRVDADPEGSYEKGTGTGTVVVVDYAESVFPVAHGSDYVKATESAPSYSPYYATDPAISMTGTGYMKSWATNEYGALQSRFHIDTGHETSLVNRVLYSNWHESGADTDRGANAFILFGSNNSTAFSTLTYDNDTNWTQIYSGAFNQHVTSNTADPQHIIFSNSTPYRYYAFKISSTHGSTYRLGIRHIELQYLESGNGGNGGNGETSKRLIIGSQEGILPVTGGIFGN